MSSSSTKIGVGDLVWAKMKGYTPWPGKVSNPGEKIKRPKHPKNMHYILFFGSNNFAWIEDQSVEPYLMNKEKKTSACKTAPFKEACSRIENYIQKKADGEIPDEDRLEEEIYKEDTQEGVEEPADVELKPKRTPKKKKPFDEEIGNGEQPSRKSLKKSVSPARKRSSLTAPVMKQALKLKKKMDLKKTMVNQNQKSSAASNFLDRPTNISRPDSTPLNVSHISQTLKDKDIVPSELTFGFLGLGIMGSGIVRNLLNSGHKVWIWNRTPDKCKDFVPVGAEQGMTPSDVIHAADITFACVADPQAAKDMVFGNCGVLQEMSASKGYVEMTGTDAETSQDIAEAIGSKGGRYLEAQVQGSKTESEEGNLIILAAGDRSLFEDCQSAFRAIGKHSFFIGEVGSASKMNLVLQLIAGITVSALAEGMALADRAGLQQRDVLEILNLTSTSSPLIRDKGAAIMDGNFTTHQPLQNMQKDLNLVLGMGNLLEQPLPLAATANEVYKHAKRLGYGEHDTSAVYIRARF